jgi:hypothetical protein
VEAECTARRYLLAAVDADKEYFDGAKNYRCTLPANIPENNFWSFTVYDNQTRSNLPGGFAAGPTRAAIEGPVEVTEDDVTAPTDVEGATSGASQEVTRFAAVERAAVPRAAHHRRMVTSHDQEGRRSRFIGRPDEE